MWKKTDDRSSLLSRCAPMNLFRAVRGRLDRRRQEAEWRRELYEYEGPIGREGTVWGHGPGVHLEDRAAWEWLEEDEPEELREWSERVRSELPSLPPDALLYDLDAGLGIPELSAKDPVVHKRVGDLHRGVLGAFRRATTPDEWIYAIDEPEAGYYYCYRFWPHRAAETTKWYVSPVPDGDDEFFVSSDFSWGLLGLFGGFPSSDWQVCVFGERLLAALADESVPALSTRLEGDAFSQHDPEERALESDTAVLMFKVGLNCELAREHGLWNRDLERRYSELQGLEESRGPEGSLEVVAGLIARVELALAEAGVEYEPALSHLDDEAT